jgi:hypothetical protein
MVSNSLPAFQSFNYSNLLESGQSYNYERIFAMKNARLIHYGKIVLEIAKKAYTSGDHELFRRCNDRLNVIFLRLKY